LANLFYYDTLNTTWTSVAQFNGPVRCLYYKNNTNMLYIGGSFQIMIQPRNINFNNICSINLSTLPTDHQFTNVVPFTYVNYPEVNGFQGAVNAIVTDGNNGDSYNYIYIGGEFTSISEGELVCNRICAYDTSTLTVYALNDESGNGFDETVYSLAFSLGHLAVAGMFTSLTSGNTYSVKSCVCLKMNNYRVQSINYISKNANTLVNGIDLYQAIKVDVTGYFIVSTNDANITENAFHYMLLLSFDFVNTSAVGGNAFLRPQTSFVIEPIYNGYIGSCGGNNYCMNGVSYSDMIFSPIIFWNGATHQPEFIDISTGKIYAFTGSLYNTFALSPERQLQYNGVAYSYGIQIKPIGTGKGMNTTLLWDGEYYSLVSGYGNVVPS
jgi:hypothetical protein